MPINEIVANLSVAFDTLPAKVIVGGIVLIVAGYYIAAAALIAGLVIYTYWPS